MPELDIILVLAVAAGATVLFVTEKLRIDVAALTILIALLSLRLILPGQALYGFSNPATATVACMFVLSAGRVPFHRFLKAGHTTESDFLGRRRPPDPEVLAFLTATHL